MDLSVDLVESEHLEANLEALHEALHRRRWGNLGIDELSLPREELLALSPPVRLVVERTQPWRVVDALLGVCAREDLRFSRLEYEVRGHGPREFPRVDSRFQREVLPERFDLVVSREEGDSADVVVSLPGAEVSVPAGEDFESEAFVRMANVAWGRLGERLQSAPRRRTWRVDMRLADGVPWAHVVKVVDLLRGRGAKVVQLGQWKLTFHRVPGEESPSKGGDASRKR